MYNNNHNNNNINRKNLLSISFDNILDIKSNDKNKLLNNITFNNLEKSKSDNSFIANKVYVQNKSKIINNENKQKIIENKQKIIENKFEIIDIPINNHQIHYTLNDNYNYNNYNNNDSYYTICIDNIKISTLKLNKLLYNDGIIKLWQDIHESDIEITNNIGSINLYDIDIYNYSISGTVSIYNLDNNHLYQGIITDEYINNMKTVKLYLSNRPIIPLSIKFKGVIIIEINLKN